MNQTNLDKTDNINEISIVDIGFKIKSLINFLKSKWKLIAMFSLIGGLIGLGLSLFKKTTYEAVCTFVLDDSRNNNLGQYAGLASMVGINVGGSGGIFEGDNILELYKSRLMIEKTLLLPEVFDGKKQLLIDRLIDQYVPANKEENKKRITFTGDPEKFNRSQDSVVSVLVDLINTKLLKVSKPDKKLNIISVNVITKDELFSKVFTDRLVQTVNNFYVQTKTKKESLNVQILQRQVDSSKVALNSSISGVASAIDAVPNANPLVVSLKTTSQKRQVDVQTNSALYGELIKNLEIAKIALREEVPLIQVIDKPVLPLKKNKLGKIKAIVIGLFVGGLLITLFLIFKKLINKALK
jgi:hypothetical protein